MMDNLKPKTAPKDFFLQLGVMVAFYAIVIAWLNLLFRVINVAWPPVGYFSIANSSISFPVALLIIVFPLLVLLAWSAERVYRAAPEKRQLWVRRWLLMLTLFLAALLLVGDLVTLLYYFLDGQELTTAFLLKVLAVLVASGGVFGYMLQDFRDRLTRPGRRLWTLLAAVLIIGGIVAGFLVIGSPRTQRLARYDDQRVNDLQNLQYQIIDYWRQHQAPPTQLSDLTDSLTNNSLPRDPETNQPYRYQALGKYTFQLCADFALTTKAGELSRLTVSKPLVPGTGDDNWQHGVGHVCFSRTIDPRRYPPLAKPVN